ncbi:MAG: hypothetical protein JF610_05610 [Acidobacteria bacterium]|nr:hypothetical protein [Acidobacteriota bacterium]
MTAPAVQAQVPATIVGSLANFDAVNDTPHEAQGFEIEMEGVQAQDVTRVFGQIGGQCYIRYCIGSITPFGTVGVAPWGVRVRWTASYNPATQTFTTPNGAPGAGSSGTPVRVPGNGAVYVSGEACWSLGAGANYPTSGCEHFGISTAYGKYPTNTVYRWLYGDPANGQFFYTPTFNGAPIAPTPPPVPIAQPKLVPAVVNGVQNVDVVIPAPPAPPKAPAAPFANRYGPAQWVKIYKSKVEQPDNVKLEELLGGFDSPKDANGVPIVPMAKVGADGAPVLDAGGNPVLNDNAAVETEWKLLQFDVTNPDNGSSQIENHGNGGGKPIVRRYEFFKYTGPVIAPGGTSGGGNKKGVPQPTYSTDGQEQSACPRGATGECMSAPPSELGEFIGAQMAAENNPGAVVLIDQTISGFKLPVAPVFGDAFALTASGGGSGEPVTYAASGACSISGSNLSFTGTGMCMVTASQAGNISFAAAPDLTLTVGVAKAPATVSFDAPSLDQVYDGTAKTVATTTTPPGLAVDLTFTGTPQAAGSYAVTATIADVNHTGSAADTLIIGKAAATATAGGGTKVYGAADPALTATSSGFLAADVIVVSASRAAGENVGSYATTATATGAALSNYDVTFVGGTFTINTAAATVTAGDGSKVFGAADPLLTATATGFLAADGIVVSASRAAGENVGSYTTTATASGAAIANYAVTYVAGAFSITPATATVALGNLSQTFTGAPLSPTVTTVPAGLAVVVTGAPQTAAGSYVVTATVADPNYDGTASGTFVITAPVVTGDDDNDHDNGKGKGRDKDRDKNDHRKDKDKDDDNRNDRNDRDR